MAEIIERGQLPQEKEYITTCSKCKTKFKFKRGEARERDGGRNDTYLEIRCPLEGCGNSCSVDPNPSHNYGYYDR